MEQSPQKEEDQVKETKDEETQQKEEEDIEYLQPNWD